MNRTVDDVIAELDAFVASGEEYEDVDRLDDIVDGLRSMSEVNEAATEQVRESAKQFLDFQGESS